MDTNCHAVLQTSIVLHQVALYKKILSYIIPVRIREGSSEENPSLELFLYRGDYQLATPDAVYSDGKRYRPLVAAFKEIDAELHGISNVLVLGTGLGSAVQILAHKGYHPAFTLVEKDCLILDWAMELLKNQMQAQALNAVCADAAVFIKDNKAQFDLIIVDVFSGRIVPGFVTNTEFLKDCRRSMNSGGSLILNYIINNEQEWEKTLHRFRSVFSSYDIVSFGINRVIIAKA